MFLRNKHTGQVLEVNGGQAYIHLGDIAIVFKSLEELNRNWEDCDESQK